MKLGIITGLEVEAAILHKAAADHDEGQRPLINSGFGPENAARAARELAALGATALISFGFTGGLDPALKVADLILAELIIGAGGATLSPDPDWQASASRLFAQLNVIPVPLYSDRVVIARPEDKAQLFEETGASAVDMESFAVGEVAAELGLKFLVLRAVLDPADQIIPQSALAGYSEDGTISKADIAGALMARPQDMPAMIQLGIDNRKAQQTLSGVARLGLPLFGLV
jgi:adenosylhomocysteine nucleosidase